MRNALYIPNVIHHLILPFILHETCLDVDESLKLQLGSYATVINHSIHDLVSGLCIHLRLKGIFSYFPT